MARPIKDTSAEPLDQNLLLRVTQTQKHKLLPEYAAASGMTESDYARNRLFNAAPRERIATPERAELIKALGQLGFIRSDMIHVRADINQILKDRWAYKFVNPEQVEASLTALAKAIADVEAIADKVFNNLDNEH